jgi:hypothetical protein
MRTSPITLNESKRLIELEKIIEAGKQTFIEVGIALAEIRDARLYKADFKTFEEYCVKKWGWTKQHCYRLIECAPIAKSNPQVTSINQVRALAKVPEEKRNQVIKKALAKSKSAGRKLTAKDISAAAETEPEPPEPARVQSYTPDPKPITTTGEEAKVFCPRAQTKRKLECWYFRAPKQKRGQFLNLIFSFSEEIEVEDTAKFKEQIDIWFNRNVKESAK